MKKILVLCLLVLVFSFSLAFVGCTKEEQKWTVTFKANGEVVQTFDDISSSAQVTLPQNPIKSGYEFDGWYFGEIKFSKDYEIKSDVVFEAKFNIIEYTITIDRADGEDTEIKFTDVNKADKLALVALTTDTAAYTYSWESALPTALSLQDYTFKEVKTAVEYTITIDRADGEDVEIKFTDANKADKLALVALTTDTDSAKYSWESALPTALSLQNYTFKEVKIVKVTVTYDGGDSTGVWQGDKASTKSVTKDGFTFDGWYNGTEAWDFENDVVSENVDLISHWTRDITLSSITWIQPTFLQIEASEEHKIANSAVTSINMTAKYNGVATTITNVTYANETKLCVYLTYANAMGDSFEIAKGSSFEQGVNKFVLAEDFKVVCIGSQWKLYVDELSISSVAYSSKTYFQFESKNNTFDKSVSAGWLPNGFVYANGEALNDVALSYHSDATVIRFTSNNFPTTASGDYLVPTIVIKKHAYISQGSIGYILDKDYTFVYNSASGVERWSLLKEASIASLSWSENAGSIQFPTSSLKVNVRTVVLRL